MLDGLRRGIIALLNELHLLRRLDGTVIGLNPLGEIELRDMARDAWFWCEAWQRAEKRAMDDLANGRYEDFRDLEELNRALAKTSADPVAAGLRQRAP